MLSMPSAVRGPQPATAGLCVSRFRVISKREPKMTKYKLEYIWLDGYKPVPNLRGKTQLKNYDSLPTLEELPLWGFDGSSTQQAEGQLGLRAQAGRGLSGRRARQRPPRVVRGHDARRQPASFEHAGNHPRRSRRVVRLRAGIFLLQGWPPARRPRDRLSGPAGPLLHGRRLQECWRHRPQDGRGA